VEPAVPQSCHHALPKLRYRHKCMGAPSRYQLVAPGLLASPSLSSFPNRFMTEADAVACALQRGEAWIDNRLGRLRSRTDQSTRG